MLNEDRLEGCCHPGQILRCLLFEYKNGIQMSLLWLTVLEQTIRLFLPKKQARNKQTASKREGAQLCLPMLLMFNYLAPQNEDFVVVVLLDS